MAASTWWTTTPVRSSAARNTGRGATELGALTTHQYALDDVADAFATAEDKTTGAINVPAASVTTSGRRARRS